ncbi:MAG: hypothetical protein MHM6MM_002636 [Cercozoa sp. M6MM]
MAQAAKAAGMLGAAMWSKLEQQYDNDEAHDDLNVYSIVERLISLQATLDAYENEAKLEAVMHDAPSSQYTTTQPSVLSRQIRYVSHGKRQLRVILRLIALMLQDFELPQPPPFELVSASLGETPRTEVPVPTATPSGSLKQGSSDRSSSAPTRRSPTPRPTSEHVSQAQKRTMEHVRRKISPQANAVPSRDTSNAATPKARLPSQRSPTPPSRFHHAAHRHWQFVGQHSATSNAQVPRKHCRSPGRACNPRANA